MKKAELLAQIEATTKGIVKVEPVLAGGTEPEVLNMLNGIEVRKYTVNVAIPQGDGVTFQNMPIVVFNEGQENEEASLSQGVQTPRRKDFETKANNYLNKKVTDGVFLGFKVTEYNEEFKYVIASIIENDAGTMTQKSVVVYKPTSTPITHVPYAE